MKKIALRFLVAAVIISMVGIFSLTSCKEPEVIVETVTETVVETVEVEKETTTDETTSVEKELKFAFSVAILDNPYFIEVANGFEDRCEELGIEAIISDAKYDAAEQYSQFENYIALEVDAICAAPVDTKSLEEVVSQAKDAGIVVIGEAQGIANADGNVIVNDYEYGVSIGKTAAEWINEKLGGEAKVLLITLDHVEAVILRGDGMRDVITDETGAEIIGRQAAQTTEEALNIAETVLQADPDVKVISCVNDQLAIGATEAVRNLGLAGPDFFVGGADNTAEGQAKMMEEGSVFRVTIDIDPYGTGKVCADVMYDYVMNGVKNETIYFEMIPVWQEDLTQ